MPELAFISAMLRRIGTDAPMPERVTGEDAASAAGIDPWTARARPAFLYVMYAMILWAIPVGLVAGFSPRTAQAMAEGTAGYLAALPEPFYALLAAGYLGYTAARQWGKVAGSDR